MDNVRPGGTRQELEARARRVLDGEADHGLVTVFDEEGMIDFGLNVTTPQIRNALLSYARDLAAYEGGRSDG